MKKKIAIVLVLIIVVFACVGCKYELELNWPIIIHATATPEPTPESTCPYHAQHFDAIVR